MRHRVVLYNPKAVFFDLPLALLSIASALDPARFEVVIIDGRIDDDPLQKLLSACDGALCLGVTALTGSPLRDALMVSRAVKSRFPGLKIVWGGWHPSLFPTETLRDEPSVDITVQAQGEETFRILCEHLAHRVPLDLVQGLTFRHPQGGEIQQNPGRHLVPMNSLPRVNYDLIEVEKYFKKKGQRQFDYISSTGCRFRCTFCADPHVFERGWTAIEPERMGEELEFWHRKHRFTDLNFQDETFFTKRERVNEIARQFIDRRISTTWAGTLRADQASRMTDEEFDLVKKSGFRRALIGVESGSQEMMDWLKKDIKLEQVLEAARRCKSRDIAAIFPFIVGFPGETDASVAASLRLARQLNAMHPLFTTPIFYFKPYPGSAITKEVEARGYSLPNTIEAWADFDYIGSSGPWVSPEKYRLVERFKFYNKLAWRQNPLALKPLEWLARLRFQFDFFEFPIEKMLAETLRPAQRLS